MLLRKTAILYEAVDKLQFIGVLLLYFSCQQLQEKYEKKSRSRGRGSRSEKSEHAAFF
jgi:hypothetical protein